MSSSAYNARDCEQADPAQINEEQLALAIRTIADKPARTQERSGTTGAGAGLTQGIFTGFASTRASGNALPTLG
eukprot:6250923-Amphidinium_carterae.1